MTASTPASAPTSNKALTATLRVLDRPIVSIYRPNPEAWECGGTLSMCVCGAPSFSQPCATCGYYPMGRDDAELKRCANKATREDFIRAVNAAGNIGAWFFQGKKSTVAYRENPTYRAAVDATIEQTKGMEWPSPERIWDAFEAKRKAQKALNDKWLGEVATRAHLQAARSFGYRSASQFR